MKSLNKNLILVTIQNLYFAPPEKGGREVYFGEMAEWLKAHAWKACKPQKGFAGSNPALSAEG